MRVTTSSMYNNFNTRQSAIMNELTRVNDQISSQKEVRFGYDNVNSFTNALRLNYDKVTIEQTISTTTSSRTFSDNTDNALSAMTKTLDTFKQKLITAASGANNTTNYTALASELRGLLSHMTDLANTSINGQFLFSGSAMTVKPFDDNGNYYGNDQSLNALVGSKVEIPYNVDGQSLILGEDSDYSRSVTTNIPLVNRTKENASIIERITSDKRYYSNLENNFSPRTESIKSTDYIADMTGDYTNNTYFYISGKMHDGSAVKTKISLTPDAKVSDLLSKIESAFGNTVKATLSDDGFIQVQDTQTGSSQLDFQMVASDTNSTTTNIMNDLTPSARLYEFNRSGSTPRNQNTLNGVTRAYDHTTFDFNTQFTLKESGLYANSGDTLGNTIGSFSDITLGFTYKDAAGVTQTYPTTTLGLSATSTIGDVVSKIQKQLDTTIPSPNKFTVSYNNGKISIKDKTDGLEADETSALLSVALTATPTTAGNGVFEGSSAIEKDKVYWNVSGNTLSSNVSQIITKNNKNNFNDYASSSTHLFDTASVDTLQGSSFTLNGTTIAGKSVTTTFNTNSMITVPSDYTLTRDHILPTGATAINITAANIPAGKSVVVVSSTGVETTYTNASADFTVTAGQTIKTGSTIPDGTSYPGVTMSVSYNGGASTTYTIPTLPLTSTTDAGFTAPNELTYQQFSDAIGLAMSETLPATTSSSKDYQTAVTTASSKINVGLNYKGQLEIKDLTTAQTSAQMTLFDSTTSDYSGTSKTALSFNENNALTIDDPKLDIFKQLSAIIDQVELGKINPDGTATSNQRGVGIQNGITLIDHIYDHISKKQTENGANANALTYTKDRAEILKVNVKTLESNYVDVDYQEAYVKLNMLSLNYQALASSIAKMNQLSLVQYL